MAQSFLFVLSIVLFESMETLANTIENTNKDKTTKLVELIKLDPSLKLDIPIEEL